METMQKFSGVLSPVVTPFKPDLTPDGEMLARQCHWLLRQRCGLAVFGTNSEANSLSVDEKIDLLDELIDEGVDAGRMMPGTGACAIPDAVRLTAHAVKLGCRGVLMLPPFYYKGVSDEGMFRTYSEVIQRVGDARLCIYLYHIPPVSQIPLTPNLIERLIKTYPGTVVGMKDSGGDWENTRSMIKRFPGFAVFAGNETFLLRTMRVGGAGCISATANINAAAIHDLYVTWRSSEAPTKQAALDGLRALMERFPMIPALKEVVACFSGNDTWRVVRPPLVELSGDQKADLLAALQARGFSMPGLGQGVN